MNVTLTVAFEELKEKLATQGRGTGAFPAAHVLDGSDNSLSGLLDPGRSSVTLMVL